MRQPKKCRSQTGILRKLKFYSFYTLLRPKRSQPEIRVVNNYWGIKFLFLAARLNMFYLRSRFFLIALFTRYNPISVILPPIPMETVSCSPKMSAPKRTATMGLI
jgi:hypothetical protein